MFAPDDGAAGGAGGAAAGGAAGAGDSKWRAQGKKQNDPEGLKQYERDNKREQRKLTSADASPSSLASSSAAPLLPLELKLSDPAALLSFYQQHGYVLERGVPEAKQLFGEIAAAKPRAAKFSTLIAGKMVQLDTLAAKGADAAKGFTISMLTMAIGLAIATTNKYTGVPIAHLAAASVKILSCNAGEGEQLVHWGSLAAWMGKSAWSFLGYCSPGTRSTALPRFPPSAIPQSEEPAELRSKFATLFDKANYHDVEVDVGDFSFFGEGFPHFGKKQNKARYAIFIMVIDTRMEHDTALDAFQLYEWQYCGMAWGWDSRQYADAIVRNKQHEALSRFADDDLVAAVNLLDHFGLRREYFDSDELPQWVLDVQKTVAEKEGDEEL